MGIYFIGGIRSQIYNVDEVGSIYDICNQRFEMGLFNLIFSLVFPGDQQKPFLAMTGGRR